MAGPQSREITLIYLLLGLLVVSIHLALAVLEITPVGSGRLVGVDGYVRLVRVTQLYESAAWFDGTLARANAPYGLALHWTRPFDLLLLSGALLLTPLYGFDQALFHWGTWISPLLHLGLVMALVWATAPLLNNWQRFLAAAIVLVQPGVNGYASAARPDHHMLILLIFVLALGLNWRLLIRPFQERLAIAAGAVLGFGAWLSTEFLVPLAVTFGVFALAWVLGVAEQARKALWHAAGLAAMIVFALLLERPPTELLSEDYDRISIVHLVVALIALGFWSAVRLGERKTTRLEGTWARSILTTAGAVLAAGLVYMTYPKFFGGPGVDIDPRVLERTYQNVQEMRSLLPKDGESAGEFLYFFGPIFFALPFLVHVLLSRRSQPTWHAWLYLSAAVVVYLPLSTTFARCSPYLQILLSVPLAGLVGSLYHWFENFRPTALRMVARVGLTVGLIFGPMFIGLQQAVGIDRALDIEELRHELLPSYCNVSDLTAELNRPDGLGRRARVVLAPSHFDTELLYRTRHGVVGPVFHYNVQGLVDRHRIFGAREDALARRLIDQRTIDLVLICRALVKTDGDGFLARVAKGEVPPWLRPVDLTAQAARAFLLYEVVR